VTVSPEAQTPVGTPAFQGATAFGVILDRWRTDWFFRLGVVLVAVVVSAAAFAPWLAPHDPRIGDLQNAYLQRPGGRVLLGTDQGRDVMSRVLYGPGCHP
jgi:ABC-type dipeptide/oligopeptide/nickel transport system permease subunit